MATITTTRPALAPRGADTSTLGQRIRNARWCYLFMLPSVVLR